MQNFILSLWIACLAFEKASNKHPFFGSQCIIYWKSFLFPIKTSQSYVSYHHTLWQLDFCDAKSILECWATLVYQKSIYLTKIKNGIGLTLSIISQVKGASDPALLLTNFVSSGADQKPLTWEVSLSLCISALSREFMGVYAEVASTDWDWVFLIMIISTGDGQINS